MLPTERQRLDELQAKASMSLTGKEMREKEALQIKADKEVREANPDTDYKGKVRVKVDKPHWPLPTSPRTHSAVLAHTMQRNAPQSSAVIAQERLRPVMVLRYPTGWRVEYSKRNGQRAVTKNLSSLADLARALLAVHRVKFDAGDTQKYEGVKAYIRKVYQLGYSRTGDFLTRLDYLEHGKHTTYLEKGCRCARCVAAGYDYAKGLTT